MIQSSVILISCCVAGLVCGQITGPKPDLLSFSNGDQLHGSFEGISEGPRAIWKRDDVTAPIEVAPDQVRQIVLNGGRPSVALPSLSHVALVNGDRIPGLLKSFDLSSVVIDTSFAGEITIPRDQVAMIAPSPLGGRLVYHGPFSSDEWSQVTAGSPEGLPPEAPSEKKQASTDVGHWKFSGSAWYWQASRPGTALIRREGMPDRAILRFNVAWKSRMSLAFAFHADFQQPPPKDPVGDNAATPQFASADPSFFPKLFGNSYVIQMNGNTVLLYRVGYDEGGKAVLEPVRGANYASRFAEADQAAVEVRCNRLTGEISLFINDEFVNQWSEGGDQMIGGEYFGKGSGFGFLVQGQSAVRISEIAMAEWNGMPDSARSLQVEDQDIVLLANGTDRLSGKVTGYQDGAILLEGKYGGFRFPLEDLAEIRFARGQLAKATEISGDDMRIHFSPLGRISGKPLRGTREGLRLDTALGGEMNVKLESAVILEFNPSDSFLDDWDDSF